MARRREAVPEDPRPQWLSTTGGGGAVPRASGSGQTAAVELLRIGAGATQHLPDALRLGGPWPDVVTVGRHERNSAVLHNKAASRVHCQLALRTFHVPQRDEVHEALFLCDISKCKTYVNGMPAFRPWHWVQDGDSIGVPDEEEGLEGVLDLYKVRYCSLHRLPSTLVAIPSSAEPLPKYQGQDFMAGKTVAKQPQRKQPQPRGKAAPKGGARQGRGKQRLFGDEILGQVIDLSYTDPPATYRMLVVHFDKEQGWHHVDSNGLSTWDGESFTDEIDLNQMYSQGLVRFVEDNLGEEFQTGARKRPRK